MKRNVIYERINRRSNQEEIEVVEVVEGGMRNMRIPALNYQREAVSF